MQRLWPREGRWPMWNCPGEVAWGQGNANGALESILAVDALLKKFHQCCLLKFLNGTRAYWLRVWA